MEKIKKRTCVIFGILITFAILFGGILGALLAGTVNTIRTENYTQFDSALPTRLLDINGEVITEFASDEKREMITFNQLPQHMIDALITREDRIYFDHNGFSFKALLRAVVGKLTGKSLGGGSTLTQQIAGTLYCDRTEMSYKRKIKELWWAFQMERRYSKTEILEHYLNKIYFGGGTYGVNAASKYYFGHDATKITPAEAAILVIQLSNPAYYNPFDHPNRARDRQQDVLYSMVKNGYLSQEQSDESYEEYWSNFDHTRISSSAYYNREDKAPWFSEYVRRELNNMMYGSLDINTGGFTVNTTMNLKHQQAAQEIMEYRIAYANRIFTSTTSQRKSDASSTYIPMTELLSLVFNIPELKVSAELNENKATTQFKKEINPILDVMSLMFNIEPLKVGLVNMVNAQQKESSSKTTIEGTLISIENETGYITALVGGSKFNADNQYIRAVQSKIQPGSTFKPLYYSAAIDSKKFTAVSTIDDSPYIFKTADGRPYFPQNFRGEWAGSVQLWYALAKSMNVPSLKILEGIGLDVGISRAVKLLGIPENELQARGFIQSFPVGLGTASVRPIELARAYAILGNQGREVTPIAVRSVEDRTGKIFLNPEKELRLEQRRKGNDIQIISPQTAYVVTDILKTSVQIGTMAYGTDQGAKLRYKNSNGAIYEIPAAGKTGTTQNWSDAWVAGYTPHLTTVIWFGFDSFGQTLGLGMTGSTLSGVVWGDFNRIAHEDYPYKEFSMPQTGLVKATVCSISGKILTAYCGHHQVTRYFLEGTEPKTICEFHSNQVEAKKLGEMRLQRAMLQSGEPMLKIKDTKNPLTVDLSFLDIDLSTLGDDEEDSFFKTMTKSKTTNKTSVKKTSGNLFMDDDFTKSQELSANYNAESYNFEEYKIEDEDNFDDKTDFNDSFNEMPLDELSEEKIFEDETKPDFDFSNTDFIEGASGTDAETQQDVPNENFLFD
ncbi:MAG: PBP1A family penicillin-binding protein [Treponema sp.]|nr:PBP1A family penicillin-binding protein [Treponema sp.]